MFFLFFSFFSFAIFGATKTPFTWEWKKSFWFIIYFNYWLVLVWYFVKDFSFVNFGIVGVLGINFLRLFLEPYSWFGHTLILTAYGFQLVCRESNSCWRHSVNSCHQWLKLFGKFYNHQLSVIETTQMYKAIMATDAIS